MNSQDGRAAVGSLHSAPSTRFQIEPRWCVPRVLCSERAVNVSIVARNDLSPV